MFLILLFILLQFPYFQNRASDRLESWLSQQTGTEVSIGHLYLSFPNYIEMEDVYLEDHQEDTLLYSSYLKISLDFPAMMKNTIHLPHATFRGTRIYLRSTPEDSTLNIQHIADAFITDTTLAPGYVDTIKKPWSYKIEELILSDFLFILDDQYGQKKVTALTDSLYATPSVLDFDDGIFLMDEVYGRGTHILVSSGDTSAEEVPLPDISAKSLHLEEFLLAVNHSDSIPGLLIRSDSLHASIRTLSLPENRIDIRDAVLKGTYFSSSASTSGETTVVTNNFIDLPWVISADELTLIDDTLILGNPNPGDSFDFNNFRLAGLNGQLSDVVIDSSKITGTITDLAGLIDNQVSVRKLSGTLLADQRRVVLEDLSLATRRSHVAGEFSIYTPPGGVLELDLDLHNSRVPNDELLYFAPTLSEVPLFANRSAHTFVDGSASGSLQNLRADARLEVMSGTVMDIDGRLQNLDNPKNLRIDLNIASFRSNAADMNQIAGVPTLEFPASLSASGRLSGPLSALLVDMSIQSSYGEAVADMVVNVHPDQTPAYDGTLTLNQFDLGALVKRDDLGKVTLTADVDGRGFEPATMTATFQAHLASVEYNGKVLRDIDAEGTIKDQIFAGTIVSNEPGQNLAFDGRIGFGDSPIFEFTGNAGSFDLGLLSPGLKGLTVQGNIVADLKGKDINNLVGTLEASNIVFFQNGERYVINNLALNSTQSGGVTRIEIASDLLNGYLEGTIYPAQLPALFLAHVDHYFNLHEVVEGENQLEAQNFKIELDINQAAILGIFIPGLESTGSGYIRGHFDSEQRDLELVASIRNLRFTKSFIDSLSPTLRSDNSQLKFLVGANLVRYNKLQLHQPNWEGIASNDVIESKFNITDEDGTLRYAIEPRLESLAEFYSLNLGDQLILNYENWTAGNQHRIIFGENQFSINDLTLSSEGQSLTANTVAAEGIDSTINLNFQNFRIETFTSITGNDSNLIQGRINGLLSLTEFPRNYSFNSDLTVNDLSVQNTAIGDARLIATGEPGAPHQIDLTMTGANDIRVTGAFYPTENNRLDLTANLNKFDLSVADEISMEILKEASGFANGAFTIQGTLTSPEIAGDLTFQDAMINVSYFNTPFYLHDQTIAFTPNSIDFGSFTILDSAGNDATVTGEIAHEGFSNFKFQLFVSTDHFMLSNTSPGTNGFYYGTVVLSSNLILRGTDALPIINTRVFLKEGTDIVILVPAQQNAIANREGVVEYVDMDNPSVANTNPDTLKAAIRGISMDASLEIDEATKVTVMFDPAADDKLLLVGGGNLEYGIEPSGLMSLTGRYEVQEGNYHFSLYDLVTRDFQILPGSNIVWFGNPLTGRLDIQGIYETRARARELLLSHAGPGANYAYNERMTFQVNLDVAGPLLKPEISFSIGVPENEEGAFGGAVYARLQQLNQNETELNRQVFSLIVFNQFMMDDPMNQGGSFGDELVRSSVSQVLSQQLNSLTNELLPGVDINLNLESYGTPGSGLYGETDLQVELSKAMFDDRVQIQVAGNVDVSGDGNTGDRSNDLAGDMSVEYKITDDGRYRLKAYRAREFENYIIQEYMATGLSLIFARDFDHFSNLFNKPEDMSLSEEEKQNVKKPLAGEAE